MSLPAFSHGAAADCPVFRIAASETNKFVMLVDPLVGKTSFIQVSEIFDVGGFTPRPMKTLQSPSRPGGLTRLTARICMRWAGFKVK